MTSYDFEVAAKNFAIGVLKERGCDVTIEDLQLVWFAHLLGNKKCLLYCPQMGKRYIEITYSQESDMFYIDLYEKLDHIDAHLVKADFKAHV